MLNQGMSSFCVVFTGLIQISIHICIQFSWHLFISFSQGALVAYVISRMSRWSTCTILASIKLWKIGAGSLITRHRYGKHMDSHIAETLMVSACLHAWWLHTRCRANIFNLSFWHLIDFTRCHIQHVEPIQEPVSNVQRIQKDIQHTPLFHVLTANNEKWAILPIWWW